uniref:Uncharacterized protein n=1 Tax=Corethron hystrix TaxID=216773 RepID=A0A7S1BWC4_9STRA|mmetsp:Transcript_4554/g.8874  ORF Transcript_4554/g.8874 Transcript_4554/m.8874 type:complete len:316 (+) Transcript_4554:319-1266(+)
MSRTLIQNASSENVSDSGGASSESISQEAPSLQKLCILEIARYVERFPPDAIGDYLTPEHWDEVVRCKHAQTQPIKASGGIDGVGRKNPAISLDTMNNVENKCPGLVSKVSDLLIWKDLVECNFRKGTHKRPEILSKPRPVILRILKDAKDSLTEFMVTFERGCNSQHSLSDIEDDGVTPNKWHQQLSKSYVSLAAAHITVDLLKESGIGKIIKTFTKKGEKIDSGSYDGPLSAMGSIWTSSLKRFTPLLEKWMNIAARGGVEIKQSNKISRSSSSSMSSIGVISGKYTQEDYEEDVGACARLSHAYIIVNLNLK